MYILHLKSTYIYQTTWPVNYSTVYSNSTVIVFKVKNIFIRNAQRTQQVGYIEIDINSPVQNSTILNTWNWNSLLSKQIFIGFN